MKSASKILYLVSGILGLASIVGYLIFAVLFFVGPSIAFIADLFNKAAAQSGQSIPEEVVLGVCVIFGIMFIISAALSLVSALLCFKARKALDNNKNPGPHIAAIVFGVLGGNYLAIVPAVFAFIVNGKKD